MERCPASLVQPCPEKTERPLHEKSCIDLPVPEKKNREGQCKDRHQFEEAEGGSYETGMRGDYSRPNMREHGDTRYVYL